METERASIPARTERSFSFEGRNRRIHYNFHTPHWVRGVGAEFDGETVIEMLRQAHVNEVTPVFGLCSCGNAYWDTRREDIRHPGLVKDMVAELLGAAAGSDVKVSIHFATAVNNRTIERHPDWAMVRKDGSRVDGGPDRGWAWPCLNSPHVEENLWPLLDEFLGRYKPDGLFLDMITFADDACYCHWCREKMEAEGDILGDPVAENEFRARTVDRVMSETLALVREAAPDLAVTFNNQLRFGRLTRRRDALDFVDVEAPFSWGPFVYPMRARYARAGGIPVAGMTTRFLNDWDYFGTLTPAAQMTYECAAIMATASAVCVGDHPQPTGELDPVVYDRIRDVFAYVRDREPWTLGATAVTEVAVLVDPEAADDATGGGRGRSTDIRRTESQWVVDAPAGFGDVGAAYGAGRALLEGNRDFAMVDVADSWERHRCVIAAEITVDPRLAERLAAYVDAGGSVVLIGPRPWTDAAARPVLEALAGVSYQGEGEFSSCYLSTGQGAPPQFVSGRYVCLTAGPGTAQTAAIVRPYDELDTPPIFSGYHAPPGRLDPHAGIARSGRVVTIAASLARDYWLTGNPELRTLLIDALDSLVPEPLVELEPPSPLTEVSLMQLDGRWILHLLHVTPNRTTGAQLVEDISMRRDVRLTVRPPYRVARVLRQPSGEPVPFGGADGALTLDLRGIGFHEMLLFEAE
jgi:hypothetical protein